MKNKFLISLALVGIVSIFTMRAQTLSPTVISSTGGFYTSSNAMLSFTVAEMTMVQTFSSANNFLTQGFQQPEDMWVSIPEIPVGSGGLIIFPNPTSGSFSMQFTGDEETNKVISMYNSLGQLVKQTTFDQTTGVNKVDFDISAFAQGIYVIELKLRDANGDLVPVLSKISLLK